MDRSSLEAPCPGSRDSAVAVVSGRMKCSFGIGNPENTGDCAISIAGVDANGNLLRPNLVLQPGGALGHRWVPPPGAVSIVFACFNDCVGTAVLEFDTPSV